MTEHLQPTQPAAQEQSVTSADGRAEAICKGCGRPYSRARKKKLGKRALKMDAEEAPKVPKRRFETAEELVRDFSTRHPDIAAKIRRRLSPEWEAETWKRIDKDWNLRTVDDLP
ncbi:hypothetical protein FBF27_04000 [Candidatus Saccharibacteria bacterium oral taxon 488]|nr:hypothetical protein FBF27_04000 [Candidatus Saccharibacteria bacterium oral taxon 488]